MSVSVGMNFLPGDRSDKAAVLVNAATALRPGGRLFGSTILASSDSYGAAPRALISFYNSRGIFHNAQDDLTGLRESSTCQSFRRRPDQRARLRCRV
jgi:hypothetical protein